MEPAEKFEEDKFSYDKKVVDGKTVFTVKGFIDEDAQLEGMAVPGAITFNMKGVEGINSLGIRNWVKFQKTLAGREVYYDECPPLFVKQMNMIPSILGDAKVLSVFVPFVCDSCEHEGSSLVKVEDFKSGQVKFDNTQECPNCGKKEYEIDGQPDQYFAFAN